MKNLSLTPYILPTEDASPIGLHFDVVETGSLDYAPNFGFSIFDKQKNFQHRPQHLYLTDSSRIKDVKYTRQFPNVSIHKGEYYLHNGEKVLGKIILTTDPKLIVDGVSSIPDFCIVNNPDVPVNFLEAFCKRWNENNNQQGIVMDEEATIQAMEFNGTSDKYLKGVHYNSDFKQGYLKALQSMGYSSGDIIKAYESGQDYNADLLTSTYQNRPRNGKEYLNPFSHKSREILLLSVK